jgi:hypothetical protein
MNDSKKLSLPYLIAKIKALPVTETTTEGLMGYGRYVGPDMIDRDDVLALFAPKETM